MKSNTLFPVTHRFWFLTLILVASVCLQAAPRIDSVNGNYPILASNDRQWVEIRGIEFRQGLGVFVAWPGGGVWLPAQQINYRSSTNIEISIRTTLVEEQWGTFIRNPDGTNSNLKWFDVALSIQSEPDIREVNDGDPVIASNIRQRVEVEGSDFQSNAEVRLRWPQRSSWYTLPSSQTHVDSDRRLFIDITTTLVEEEWEIKVENPDGGVTRIHRFDITLTQDTVDNGSGDERGNGGGAAGRTSPDENSGDRSSDDENRVPTYDYSSYERYGNLYPYKNADVRYLQNGDSVSGIDEWNFFKRECTSYVAWRVNFQAGTQESPYFFHNWAFSDVPTSLNDGNKWGNAVRWADRAREIQLLHPDKLKVNNIPKVGAIAFFSYGHVAYVEAVHGEGSSSSITVSEFNYWRTGDSIYGQRHIFRVRDLPAEGSLPTAYIHFNKLNTSRSTHVKHDYDGDGKTDICDYNPETGDWNIICSSTGQVEVKNWGGPGFESVEGDYNGNGKSDLAVYHHNSGNWYIRRFEDGGIPITFGQNWGGQAYRPVSGDFNGDGKFDLAVYDRFRGEWFIMSLGSSVGPENPPITFGQNWGSSQMTPVSGDYNGDGISDLAVYDEPTGNWFIRSLGAISASNPPITFGQNWGSWRMKPESGDFNGDGSTDLAVKDLFSHHWFARKLGPDGPNNPPLTFANQWGFANTESRIGDYNGDGKDDLGIYDPGSATWFVKTLDEIALFFGLEFGRQR